MRLLKWAEYQSQISQAMKNSLALLVGNLKTRSSISWKRGSVPKNRIGSEGDRSASGSILAIYLAIHQLLSDPKCPWPSHYASADAVFCGDWAWIETQWREAEAKGHGSLLVLDEIQKVELWSEYIKKLRDESILKSK